ncbi:hypothetical protein GCM10027073_33310 [Streptomyces chlorus]
MAHRGRENRVAPSDPVLTGGVTSAVMPPKPTWDPRAPMQPLFKPTVRIRLTLLYGGMFLIAGVLLLSIIYLFTAQALSNSATALPRVRCMIGSVWNVGLVRSWGGAPRSGRRANAAQARSQ